MIKKINVKRFLFIIFVAFLFTVAYHIRTEYQNIPFEQILYHFNLTDLTRSSGAVISRILLKSLVPFLFFNIIIYATFHIKKDFKFKFKNKKRKFNISKFLNKHEYKYLTVLLVFAIIFTMASLSIPSYVWNYSRESDFIRNHYVDPREVEFVFPEEKRNLIFIFLESVESTFALEANGGYWQRSIIPELEQLAMDNVNFSHNNNIGGFHEAHGTWWTIASMVGQTAGLPVKIPMRGGQGNYLGEFSAFMPGAYSLGRILESAGYNQTLMIGSNADFGGRRNYFTQHGNYNIIDHQEAINREWIDEDYYVWWGFEDKKLFEFAKKELLYKASKDEPFNFTMLTADTHFFNGYLDETCEFDLYSQYENVFVCSSRMVYNFIKWLELQDFYENTTIIITGDHHTMQSNFVNPRYTRTLYNAFINTTIRPLYEKNRTFTTFDIFPTTLASLNIKIPGDRLGLGTNLFSDRRTLAEEFGLIYMDRELAKNSSFYNGFILRETYFEIHGR